MQKIVIICGPTSSGKTRLGLELAKLINAEIISADSRQIYRELNIGTNKGDLSNIETPIHLINIRNPNERYSVYDFKNDCEIKLKEIDQKGKNALIVGGTGLYIDSIYKNYQLTDALENKYENLNINELKSLYEQNYLEEFGQLNYSDQNNSRRLSMHLSKLDKGISLNSKENPNYEFLFIYPKFEREELRIRIENRVEEMFAEGIVTETKHVLDKYGKNCIALQGLGYKEIVQLLNNQITGKECIQLVKNSHNQYAKRQVTWFEGEGRNYPLNRVDGIDDTIDLVRNFLK